MQASSSVGVRRIQNRAGYSLLIVLVEMVAAGCRAVARGLAALATAQRQAQARSELLHLSDRSLKDIGLSRSQIDQMFR